jgi:diguanylate cyclase (GGDEF)-like protein/PAS domain S-box-containing protein
MFFFLAILVMTVYEALKELLLPAITGWPAHVLDIAVVSCGFLLATLFFQKKAAPAPSTEPSLSKFYKQQWLASTLFDNLDDAVIMTDKDNLIIAFNSAFEKITGDSPDEILGKKPQILFNSKYSPEFYDEFWNTLTTTGRWEGEIWSRRQDGEIFVEWFSMKQVFDDKGDFSHHIGVFSDLNPQNTSFERIQHLMYYDVLTNLPNKTLLIDHFQKAIANAQREDNFAAVLCLKIDKFEQFINKHGFDIADEVLKGVSIRLQEVIQRKSDTLSVSRTGGDEFVVLLAVIKQAQNAMMVAENIRETLNEPFEIGDQSFQISVSIGVAIFPEHGKDEGTLLTHVYTALNEARYNGGSNRVKLYQKLIDIKPII